jgi:hypothetical protein
VPDNVQLRLTRAAQYLVAGRVDVARADVRGPPGASAAGADWTDVADAMGRRAGRGAGGAEPTAAQAASLRAPHESARHGEAPSRLQLRAGIPDVPRPLGTQAGPAPATARARPIGRSASSSSWPAATSGWD